MTPFMKSLNTLLTKEIANSTRMHSSRMCATHLRIVRGGGRCCPGEVIIQRGDVVTWSRGRGREGERCCDLVGGGVVTFGVAHLPPPELK